MMDESGTVWADRDITVDVNRSAVPGAIAAGHTLRWELSSHLSGRDIAALPKDQKIVELLTGIHEGHTLVFNEQNKQVGQLTKEAKKAVVELGRYLDIVHTPLCTHGAEASSRAS
ncbi:MAG: hypothetical protein LBQ51_07240 [Desulfovibrio sp.]|nr:hypothetical protein [Desulfovibrio sp.]